MSYKFLQCLITTSTLISSIICGGLIIKNHEEIDFNNYSNLEKSQFCVMMYVDVFYFLFVLYYVLKTIWSGIVFCWTDNYDDKPKFSIITLLAILLASIGNFYLLYYLGKDKLILNKEFTITSSILVSNMFFGILSSIVNKICLWYTNSEKLEKKYEEF